MDTAPFRFLSSLDFPLACSFLSRSDACSSDDDIARRSGRSSVVSLRQVHGNRAEYVTQPSRRTLHADALLTDQPDLFLTIRFADCQGLLLVDTAHAAFAVAHAGWKGLVAGIIPATIAAMRDRFATDPASLRVGIAPSLCRTCAAFTDPTREVPSLAAFTIERTVDLRAAADAALIGCGVKEDHIERLPDCTRCNPDRYFTYRGGDKELVMAGATNVLVVGIERGHCVS